MSVAKFNNHVRPGIAYPPLLALTAQLKCTSLKILFNPHWGAIARSAEKPRCLTLVAQQLVPSGKRHLAGKLWLKPALK